MSTFDVSSAKTLNRENTSLLYSLINSLACRHIITTNGTVVANSAGTYATLCGAGVPLAEDEMAVAIGQINFSIGDTAPSFSVALTGGGTGALTVNSTMRLGVFIDNALASFEPVQCGIVNSSSGLQQLASVIYVAMGLSGNKLFELRFAKNVAPATATIYATGRMDILVFKYGGG